jgi:DNA polymerase-1
MFYLIDMSHIIHQQYHGLPAMFRPSDNHPVGVVHGCMTMFWRLMQHEPTHIAAIFDDPLGSSQRKAMYAPYKGTRPPLEDDLIKQFPLARRCPTAFSVNQLEMPGYEADDIIATYCRMAGESGNQVIVVTSDKDLFQLLTIPEVIIYDPKYQRMVTPDYVQSKFGVTPAQMGDYLALMGDKTDNIPGVKGVGEKTAALLLNEFGTLHNILDNASSIKKPAIRAAMELQRDRRDAGDPLCESILSKRLVDLQYDAPVEAEIEHYAFNGFDRSQVLDFLDEMELVTLRQDIANAELEAAA